ncbi:MAG TPA: hypothetical protein VJH03_04815 [Blastocatellia bacterium]|nr:hypothetical protein [Blastocatellia bacterium]
MKTRLTIGLLSLSAILAVVVQAFSGPPQRKVSDDWDLPERDEIHQTYELSLGGRVEVRGINGPVEIETGSGTRAEVNIVRSARNREDLNYRKIIVEQSSSSLVVRGENQREGDWGRHRRIRERVSLKLPRQIELTMSGINASAHVGEIDGPVHLSGINGRVDVAQALGYTNLSGINGVVTLKMAGLSERGVRVSGVNGRVELRFAGSLDADVEVTGINGSVDADIPEMTIVGKQSRQSFRARIGAGGTPISVSGVNGSVRLTRGGSSG